MIIKESIVQARKTHKCIWCGLGIIKKSKYLRSNVKDKDKIFVQKSHLICADEISRLGWFDEDEWIDENALADHLEECSDEYRQWYEFHSKLDAAVS